MEQQTWLNFVTTLQAHNIFINFRYRRSDRLLKNVLLGLVSNYTLNVFVMLHRVLTMHTQLEYFNIIHSALFISYISTRRISCVTKMKHINGSICNFRYIICNCQFVSIFIIFRYCFTLRKKLTTTMSFCVTISFDIHIIIYKNRIRICVVFILPI